MKGTFTLSVAPWLEDIAAAGADIDKVVQDVLTTYVAPLESELHANLRKTSETWTGEAEKTLFANDVQQDGNFSYIEFGADTSQDPAAQYKEFGTARQAAEPFLRPTLVSARKHIKTMLKKVCEEMGLRV